MLGSRVLALWRGINASIPKIIGLGIYFGINPQTLKEIASSLKTPTLQVICVVVNSAKMLGMTTLKRLRRS